VIDNAKVVPDGCEERKRAPKQNQNTSERRRKTKRLAGFLDAIAIGSPEVKIKSGRVVPNHPHQPTGLALLMEALGTEDLAFVQALLVRLANVGPVGSEVESANANFLLSMVKGVKPKDQGRGYARRPNG
jgi:hypothetical protein